MTTTPLDPSDPERWEAEGRKELTIQCEFCSEIHSMWVFPADMARFLGGEGYIQNLMPYLTPGERELLINKVCVPCFDRMCPPDED